MIDSYLAAMQATGKSEQTIKTYRSQLQKFMNWLLENSGTTDAKEITSIDAVEYRTYLQEVRKLKPASINTALAAIEAFCNWMLEEGYINHRPLAKVRKVEEVQEPPKWLDKSEKYRLIRTALNDKSKRNRAIIFTLLLAGLRVSELVSLTPDDIIISERKGSITVIGKGNKRRTVPMPKDLRECLSDYLVDNAGITWLFGSQRGEQLTVKGVQHLCASIGGKAGVDGLTPHMLRHTYCHDLVGKGVPIEMVAKLAGHSKIETTKIYTQPGEQEMQAAVEKLGFS
ncbi:Tyrosine recombinase XerD [Sporomusa rhizae]|uniref:tyrosine-type recombinase/integrase n=1 Tax=Sporomusa rhizae TaxID=357999 RepID=UPI00352B58D0